MLAKRLSASKALLSSEGLTLKKKSEECVIRGGGGESCKHAYGCQVNVRWGRELVPLRKMATFSTFPISLLGVTLHYFRKLLRVGTVPCIHTDINGLNYEKGEMAQVNRRTLEWIYSLVRRMVLLSQLLFFSLFFVLGSHRHLPRNCRWKSAVSRT